MAEKFHEDNLTTIYNKDARDMGELSDNSVQCVVTSPPYWGLRKYSGEQEVIWNVSSASKKQNSNGGGLGECQSVRTAGINLANTSGGLGLNGQTANRR